MQTIAMVVGILAVIAVGFWLASRKQKVDEGQLEKLAQAHGWQYEKSFDLSQMGSGNVLRYRLTGRVNAGESWRLDIESHSLKGPGALTIQTTVWRTDGAKFPEGLILIGPRPKDMPANLDFGGALTQMVLPMLLKRMLGESVVHTADLKEVRNGYPELQRYYLTFATDESSLSRLLNSESQKALAVATQSLKEKQRPAALLWDAGLQLKCDGLITDGAALERLVELGEVLTAAWKN